MPLGALTSSLEAADRLSIRPLSSAVEFFRLLFIQYNIYVLIIHKINNYITLIFKLIILYKPRNHQGS